MVALIQSENHASNIGKMAGRYQFDTQPTGIELMQIRCHIKIHIHIYFKIIKKITYM